MFLSEEISSWFFHALKTISVNMKKLYSLDIENRIGQWIYYNCILENFTLHNFSLFPRYLISKDTLFKYLLYDYPEDCIILQRFRFHLCWQKVKFEVNHCFFSNVFYNFWLIVLHLQRFFSILFIIRNFNLFWRI